MATAVPDLVIVVKHEDDLYRQPHQLVDQHRNNCSRDVRGLGRKDAQDIAAKFRAGLPKSGHNVPPQPAGVIVTVVERQPCDRAVFGRCGSPLRHERRLAEARGSINQDQFGRSSARQFAEQPGPVHPFLARVRTMQLRVDGHVNRGTYGGQADDRTHDAFRRPRFLGAPGASHVSTIGMEQRDKTGSKVLQKLGPWPVSAVRGHLGPACTTSRPTGRTARSRCPRSRARSIRRRWPSVAGAGVAVQRLGWYGPSSAVSRAYAAATAAAWAAVRMVCGRARNAGMSPSGASTGAWPG